MNGVTGARQSRDPAYAAAQVDSPLCYIIVIKEKTTNTLFLRTDFQFYSMSNKKHLFVHLIESVDVLSCFVIIIKYNIR